MADYKRMVSYMYQYENGIKKKNVGYARIEARNGQCKITLHMQLLGQYDSIFPTYLIHRDDNGMELVYLGDSLLKNQIMDSKLIADDGNIMDSGYGLSDMGGMLIFLNEDVFFATEWDDKPIIAKEVLDSMNPNKEEKDLSMKDSATVTEPIESIDLPKEDITSETDLAEQKQTEESVAASDEKAEEELITEIEEEKIDAAENIQPKEDKKVQQEANMEETIPVNIEPEEKTLNETKIDPNIIKEFENTMPVYKLPRGWKTVERLNNKQSGKSAFEEKEDMAAIQADNTNKDAVQADRNLGNKKMGTMDNTPLEEQEERPDSPLAARIFENYPRIYPFEDNEIILCVKIEPKDIGFFPTDTWVLNSNSFLLHGYYCYRHLIFAKIKDRYGCRYILGVPGIYHNREKFMARMFGFDNFKSIRKRELRQGDFGYWYIQVNM